MWLNAKKKEHLKRPKLPEPTVGLSLSRGCTYSQLFYNKYYISNLRNPPTYCVC